MTTLDQVAGALARSRRYRSLDAGLLRRVAGEALAAGGGEREALKRAKRALHQAAGAYRGDRPHYARLCEELRTAAEGGSDALREGLRAALARHASSRERLPVLEPLYAAIFARTGSPAVLLDLACGLNPLAAPWMGLPDGVRYCAFDIDLEQLELVTTALELLGVQGRAGVVDLAVETPTEPADLALLLRSWPVLEHQRPGRGVALLRELDCPRAVVSFPTRSLGGRERGMRSHYARDFESALAGEPWRVERLDVPGELVYLVERT
jgi:16S rRNA (guanine(1405)-N(7))-methyltransferase